MATRNVAGFAGFNATAAALASAMPAPRLHDAPPSVDISAPRLVAARIVDGELGLTSSPLVVKPLVPVFSGIHDAAASVLLKIVDDAPPAYSVAPSAGSTASDSTCDAVSPLFACDQCAPLSVDLKTP